jgi:hypothetical protein
MRVKAWQRCGLGRPLCGQASLVGIALTFIGDKASLFVVLLTGIFAARVGVGREAGHHHHVDGAPHAGAQVTHVVGGPERPVQELALEAVQLVVRLVHVDVRGDGALDAVEQHRRVGAARSSTGALTEGHCGGEESYLVCVAPELRAGGAVACVDADAGGAKPLDVLEPSVDSGERKGGGLRGRAEHALELAPAVRGGSGAAVEAPVAVARAGPRTGRGLLPSGRGEARGRRVGFQG